ncbi:MAG TPA: GvpL/GvpF family gas vesicle protein, partial [Longimicrobiales bacterium]|nr:GvpL/GvpF family gas vesicle protein [Longimicrobiales bacterium]
MADHDGGAGETNGEPLSRRARSGVPAARDTSRGRLPPHQALYFYGVSRARSWRRARAGGADAALPITLVRYRDLDAMVAPVEWEMPVLDEDRVRAHHEAVEAASRRATVLPAPFGIVFRGRRQLIRMMQDQYLVLDEGLALLDGHWELRLHIVAGTGAEPDLELSDVAMSLYSELRRSARAAEPFPADGRRLMSAAFLV